jgi:integrase
VASIIKRSKSYSVVYSYEDENGQKKQKWESCKTLKEAQKRKAEIEAEMLSGTFLKPNDQTVEEFLAEFVSMYGEKKWSLSMYESSTSLMRNYIIPLIGQMKVQDVTTRVADQFVAQLEKTPAVSCSTRRAATEFVSPKTIEKIVKTLRTAFKQAVRWEIISKNPFDYVVLPKTQYAKRDIWDADMIRTALDNCTDRKLYVAMNLAFACSLRMGEILGLTWNNVHIEDSDIVKDDAWIYVDKQLARASIATIEKLGNKDVYKIIEPTKLMPQHGLF